MISARNEGLVQFIINSFFSELVRHSGQTAKKFKNCARDFRAQKTLEQQFLVTMTTFEAHLQSMPIGLRITVLVVSNLSINLLRYHFKRLPINNVGILSRDTFDSIIHVGWSFYLCSSKALKSTSNKNSGIYFFYIIMNL